MEESTYSLEYTLNVSRFFLCKGGIKGHISQLSPFNFLGLFSVLASNIDYLKCANLLVLRTSCTYERKKGKLLLPLNIALHDASFS